MESDPAVLVYTSSPLPEDLEVTGPVMSTIYAATTGCDTDFTAKLVDVHPDGSAMNLAENITRARYRHGLARQQLVTPGAVEEYSIDLYAMSNLFRAGHRIRLEVTSSSFPRFDPNPNSGGDIAHESELVAVVQTVHHSSRFPSRIVLPVVRHGVFAATAGRR